jgi:fused signal recognition particle receptor
VRSGSSTAVLEPDVLEPEVLEPDLREPAVEVPESVAGRLARLRARLTRTQQTLGRGLLAVLSRDRLDEDAWEEVEETLLAADVGVGPTTELVTKLRARLRGAEAGDPARIRTALREELIALVDPTMDRTVEVDGSGGQPGVVLVVGVNGTGKTTTVGRIARVLVSQDKTVLLGRRGHLPRRRRGPAPDVGRTGRRPDGAWGRRQRSRQRRLRGRPARRGGEGRHRAGRHRRPPAHQVGSDGRARQGQTGDREAGPVSEVLLVIDATTGQNGLTQARVFREVVDVTGIVLTKLDGTAKGGIVIAVQRELGVPVKLVGLGEGADDLAPFEADVFVDALLGD